MVKSIYLPEEYKVYRDKTKKEYQERFHAHDFVHRLLMCVILLVRSQAVC